MKKRIKAIFLVMIVCVMLVPQSYAEVAMEYNQAEEYVAEEVTPAAEETVPAAEVAQVTPEIPETQDPVADEAQETEEVQDYNEPVNENSEETEEIPENQEPEGDPDVDVENENEETSVNGTAEITDIAEQVTSMFTVEFVNPEDGSEVVIPGGSDILLSVINTELNLGLNLLDVENVESSDETLFSVEKLENDYLIRSHQAFTSKEELLIYLANSGLVSVDVYDDDYTEIAEKVWNNTGAKWFEDGSDPTKEKLSEISFLGQDWYVIGFNGSGAGSEAGTMTLLLKDFIKDSDGKVVEMNFCEYNYAECYNDETSNDYYHSDIKTYLEEWYNKISSSKSDATAVLQRDLEVEEYEENPPYSDGVSGTKVEDQNVWLLSMQELYELYKNCIVAGETYLTDCLYTKLTYSWYTRSPGDDNPHVGLYYGWYDESDEEYTNYLSHDDSVGFHGDALRPALWVKLDSDFVKSLLKNDVPQNTSGDGDTAVALEVYIDGILLTYRDDYKINDGRIVVSSDYLSTLYNGIHELTTNYGFRARFSVNDSSDPSIEYSWTSGTSEGLRF